VQFKSEFIHPTDLVYLFYQRNSMYNSDFQFDNHTYVILLGCDTVWTYRNNRYQFQRNMMSPSSRSCKYGKKYVSALESTYKPTQHHNPREYRHFLSCENNKSHTDISWVCFENKYVIVCNFYYVINKEKYANYKYQVVKYNATISLSHPQIIKALNV
jgi:hypothetical protein